MGKALEELLVILELEAKGDDCFVGTSQDLGWKAVYGGQFLAQGLRACQHTVDDSRHVHSIHAYFLKRAWADAPVVYHVERLRDGHSFSSRRLLAYQHDTLVFSMQVGFQLPEEGLFHQESVSVVGAPEDFMHEQELACTYPERYPAEFRAYLQKERAFDVRPVVDFNAFAPTVLPPKRGFWCRVNGSVPQDPHLSACLALWMSDSSILGTSLFPHGLSWISSGLQITSLDHVFWFHKPIDVNEWFYYDLDSPISAGGRGFGRGSMIQKGMLVGTVMQEGLIRLTDSAISLD